MFQKALGNVVSEFTGCSIRDPVCFLKKFQNIATGIVQGDEKLKNVFKTVVNSDVGKHILGQLKNIQIGEDMVGNGIPGEYLNNKYQRKAKKMIDFADMKGQKSNQIGGCGSCKKPTKKSMGGEGLFYSGVPISQQTGGGKLKLNLNSQKLLNSYNQKGNGLTFY